MSDSVDTLILDLLAWMGPHPRPYAEVLEAWRTSCPRLPVWEDANDRGFIARHRAPGRGTLVSVSAAGADHLRKHPPAIAALRVSPRRDRSGGTGPGALRRRDRVAAEDPVEVEMRRITEPRRG